MRILVCGGRDLQDEPWVYKVLADHLRPGDVVLHGGAGGMRAVVFIPGSPTVWRATGADFIASEFAKGLGLEVIEYRADWDTYGKSAGPMRNQRMLVEGRPDLVLALPGGRGTEDMVRRARQAGVTVERVLRP